MGQISILSCSVQFEHESKLLVCGSKFKLKNQWLAVMMMLVLSIGSPFTCCVVDVGSLIVDWDAVRLRPVHCPVTVVLDTKGSPEADIACTVTGWFHADSVPTQHRGLRNCCNTSLQNEWYITAAAASSRPQQQIIWTVYLLKKLRLWRTLRLALQRLSN